MDNLINIKYLDKENIIHQLETRYSNDLIYTRIDNILIAINPFKNIKKKENHPHPDLIADNMYQGMINQNKNQSVLISGESGAGKTETTKILLKKLLSYKKNNDVNQISTLILASNIILECFGNAGTIRNHNSSRFGKLISLLYNQNKIIGAEIKTYLLEKIRVTDKDLNEKNFHCFYLLNDDYNNDLVKTNNMNLDNKININFDGENTLKKLYESFNLFELNEYIDEFKKIIKIILLLKNYKNNLNELVKLFQVNKDILIKNIEKQQIKIGNEIIYKDLTNESILIKIKTLQQELYYNMFNFIIDKINLKLKPNEYTDKNIKKIYLLDIFGFEILHNNSIEQLCINYTNEILQNEFNKYFFEKEQELYISEGLPFDLVEFTNNDDIINCIENTIFKKINEVTKFINPNDNRIINDLFKLNESKHYKINNLDKGKGRFLVNHYASAVIYKIKNFISKNNLNLSQDITNLIKLSNNKLVSSFNIKSSKKTLLQIFYRDIKQLQKIINSTQVNFIRCLKPNDSNIPNSLDKEKISMQLTYNGIIEAIAISRQGYPIRYLNKDFDESFKIIPDNEKKNLVRGFTMTFLKSDEEYNLLDRKKYILNNNARLIANIFRTYQQRSKYLNILAKVLFIQKNVRMVLSKIKLKKLKSIIKIQSIFRMFYQKNKFILTIYLPFKRIKNAIKIQKNYRMKIQKKMYNLYINSIIIIQKFFRKNILNSCEINFNLYSITITKFFKRIKLLNLIDTLKKNLLNHIYKIKKDRNQNKIKQHKLDNYNKQQMIKEDNDAKLLRDQKKNQLINHLHKENKELLDAIAQKDLMMLQKIAKLEEKLFLFSNQKENKQEKTCVIM